MTGPDGPVWADEDVWRAGVCLAAVTRVAVVYAELIDQHPVLRQLAAEAAGLLDVLTGINVTSPEARLKSHVARIEALRAELPAVDADITAGNRTERPAS